MLNDIYGNLQSNNWQFNILTLQLLGPLNKSVYHLSITDSLPFIPPILETLERLRGVTLLLAKPLKTIYTQDTCINVWLSSSLSEHVVFSSGPQYTMCLLQPNVSQCLKSKFDRQKLHKAHCTCKCAYVCVCVH